MKDLRKAWGVAAAALIVAISAACGGAEPAQIVETEVSGPGTLGISHENSATKGIVVFFHGMDQDHREPLSDAKHKELSDSLLGAGYAMVSADAGGNALGNPGSQAAYRKLIADAITAYGSDRIFFLAESMGAVPALILYGDNTIPVRGMAGVSPLMGIPPSARDISYVAAAWNGNVPDSADGMSWAPDRVVDKRFRLYASPDDTVIPKDAGADAFQAKFGQAATVDLIRCSGDHVDASCFDGDGLVKWMNAIP